MKGDELWRAQLGPVDGKTAFRPKRMVPLADRAHEGRVNPKGIPCLYCSTEKKTAMTETRPWIGSFVSLAKFVLLRDLTVVDCFSERTWIVPIFSVLAGKEPKPAEREKAVWAHINWAFSEPVTRNDDLAGYAPTQVLAETFRSAGYDGIVYGSKLGGGLNVAIFDLAAAKCTGCDLYSVDAVEPKFHHKRTP